MTKLSVNVNKVALLRNSRRGTVPSIVAAARTALDAGAAGITVHPRPDERHIRPADVDEIAAMLNESPYRDREFNIEGNPFLGQYVAIARKTRPTQCTLVPDDPDQATSDHGWDATANRDRLRPVVAELQAMGCRVSLFMDPDRAMIEAVPRTGADRIELYTESYAVAHAAGGRELDRIFAQFAGAAAKAQELGLGVNAGHDLNLANLSRFVAISGIAEVSIGHALIADALDLGLATAVGAYLRALDGIV